MRKASIAVLLCLACFATPTEKYGQEHPSVASNVPETRAVKLHEDLGQGKKVLVVDVRTPKEFAEGHIPGAVNIPLEELRKKIGETKLAKETRIITVCEHGGRSSRAVQELQELGYKTSSFCKLESWKKEGYKIKRGNSDPRPSSGLYKFTCHHFCQSDKETADLEQLCECACNKPYHECTQGN